MKKLIMACLMLALAVSVEASPWLVCDPQEGITGYSVSMDGGEWMDRPYELYDATCAKVMDLDGLAVGQHSVKVKAYAIDPVWGRQESEAAPFDFARPGVQQIINMGLKK